MNFRALKPLRLAAALALALPTGFCRAETVAALPFQKVLEASAGALDERDFERLNSLRQYMSAAFEEYRKKHSRDLHADYEAAIVSKSTAAVQAILVKLAYDDLAKQLSIPENSPLDAARPQVQLAYIDYNFVLSKKVSAVQFSADGDVRNCFKKAFQSPHSEWPSVIISKLSALLDLERPLK